MVDGPGKQSSVHLQKRENRRRLERLCRTRSFHRTCGAKSSYTFKKNHFVRSTHQLSEENRSSFHLATSRLQHTSTLRPRSIGVVHSFLFLASAATSRRSTTVIPRVSSLLTSICT